jgi:hypothetical protein
MVATTRAQSAHRGQPTRPDLGIPPGRRSRSRRHKARRIWPLCEKSKPTCRRSWSRWMSPESLGSVS